MARKKKPFHTGELVCFEYYGNTVVGLLSNANPDDLHLRVAYGYWENDEDFNSPDIMKRNVRVLTSDIDHFRHADAAQMARFCKLYLPQVLEMTTNIAILEDDVRQLKEHNSELHGFVKQYNDKIHDLEHRNSILSELVDKVHAAHRPALFGLYFKSSFPFITTKPYEQYL